jgi:HemY protein
VANGDRQTAKATYKKLLNDPKTRFVGTYGLLQQHLQDGDTELALKLAEHAFALKPKHGETQDALLKLQAGPRGLAWGTGNPDGQVETWDFAKRCA